MDSHSSIAARLCFRGVRPIAAVALLLVASDAFGQPLRFLRGDFDASGRVNITDPIAALSYLFRRGEGPPCADAADANDDGKINISDSVRLLFYLFRGLSPLPAPSLKCDFDPTGDRLGCLEFRPCIALGPPPGPDVRAPPSPTKRPSIDITGTSFAGLTVEVVGGAEVRSATVGESDEFTVTVPLKLNQVNRLFVTAENDKGFVSAAVPVTVIHDTEPPALHIDEPAAGSESFDETTRRPPCSAACPTH